MKSQVLWKIIAGVSAAIIFLLIPLVGSMYLVSLFFLLFMYMTLAQSWNIISGYAGYVSFGHVGFFGIGAYTMAITFMKVGIPWHLGAFCGGLMAAVVAALFGSTCLRLKGPYFAIAMLGLSETLRVIVLAWESLTEGGLGIPLPSVETPFPPYYEMGLVAGLLLGLTSLIARSKFGLRLMAIREDETAAEVMGINTTNYKMLAFLLSAFFPGVAGGMYTWYIRYIEPQYTFSVLITIQMAIFTLFGGKGTVMGPVLGTVVLVLLQEFLWAEFPFLHLALFGALIVVVVLFMPRGVLGILIDQGLLAKGVVR